jgi:hypothetical protein
MSSFDTIHVRVGDRIRTYPGDVAGYGTHLADGGRTLCLAEAKRQALDFFARHPKSRVPWLTIASVWATVDGSGLAYLLDFRRSGSFRIRAAAPMPGHGNVRELYDAAGYAAEA